MKCRGHGLMIFGIAIIVSSFSLLLKADSEFKFKPYGFIRANVIGASRAVDSFGNTNMSSPVAVTPSSNANSGLARDSFQVSQSRIGTWIEHETVVGRLEFDFIDFTKASPTTQSVPRLRIANIDYHMDSHQTLSAGQDWDLFSSPAKPFTYNYVGLYFYTGNVGFMRQQVRYSYRTDSGWTLGTAVGLLNRNATATDSEIETTGIPTLSVRVLNQLSPEMEVGLSAIVGKVRPSTTVSELYGVYGVNAFWNLQIESGFKFRGHFYYGQNLGSAGTLAISNASPAGSRHEAGGYLSAYYSLSEQFSLQGGVGIANIFESAGSPVGGIVGNTILSDWKGEVAFAYHPVKELSIYFQPTFLQTSYLQAASGTNDTVIATLLEGGLVFQF